MTCCTLFMGRVHNYIDKINIPCICSSIMHLNIETVLNAFQFFSRTSDPKSTIIMICNVGGA